MVIVLILGILIVVFFVWRRKKRYAEQFTDLEMKYPLSGESELTGVQLGEIISAGRVCSILLHCSGYFGEVYRGIWQGADVALKKLKDQSQVEALKKEISIWK